MKNTFNFPLSDKHLKKYWINIHTRKPTDGRMVLIYLPVEEKIIVAFLWEGEWNDNVPKLNVPYYKPSHWRPIIPNV